jgi:hypothetical protein
MHAAECGLRLLGEAGRGAHLLGDRGRHVVVALLVFRHDPFEQRQALLAAGPGKACEGGAGRGYGAVHVCSGAKADTAADLLIRGVDDVKRFWGGWLDSLAIDVEPRVIAHRRSP